MTYRDRLLGFHAGRRRRASKRSSVSAIENHLLARESLTGLSIPELPELRLRVGETTALVTPEVTVRRLPTGVAIGTRVAPLRRRRVDIANAHASGYAHSPQNTESYPERK